MPQAAATRLHLWKEQLQTSKAQLAPHSAGAQTKPRCFVTLAAHACLLQSLEVTCQLAADLDLLEAQQGYSHTVPGWHSFKTELQTAAQQAQQAQQVQQAFEEDASKGAMGSALPGQQLSDGVEGAIKQVLLWAQSMHSTDKAQPADGGFYCTMLLTGLCMSRAVYPDFCLPSALSKASALPILAFTFAKEPLHGSAVHSQALKLNDAARIVHSSHTSFPAWCC